LKSIDQRKGSNIPMQTLDLYSPRLLRHLPAIYHGSTDLRILLTVLEEVLLGPNDVGELGLDQKISTLAGLFDPICLDPPLAVAGIDGSAELLPWLAQWVALSYHEGLSRDRFAQLITESIPLYARRGTRAYLDRMLRYFLPDRVSLRIDDQSAFALVVGTSRLGLDTWLGEDRPHWFTVQIFPDVSPQVPDELEKMKRTYDKSVRAVIELAKPAHTTYELKWQYDRADPVVSLADAYGDQVADSDWT
jgi:phage tail-like protein